MDEHCNYQTHERLGFNSKRIRQVHPWQVQSVSRAHAVPAGGSLPCRGCPAGCPVCQHCPSDTAHPGQQCRSCAGRGWLERTWGSSVRAEGANAMREWSAGQWWMGRALNKGGWAEKFNGRWKTLEMQWMRENTAQKGLVKISVWHRGWWPPQSICSASGGFLTGEAGCKQGFIWEFCVKIYNSASNSRSDCNEPDECGTRDVSGRGKMWDFLCI